MSFSTPWTDAVTSDLAKQIAQQIDRDIFKTLSGGYVSGGSRIKNSTLTEYSTEFIYDDTIDNFVYKFMDNDDFTKPEKDALYDFSQLLTEQLNLHSLCTFVSSNPETNFPIMENYSFKDEWYKSYVRANAVYPTYEVSTDMMLLLSQSKLDKYHTMELWVGSIVRELHGSLINFLKKETDYLKAVEIDPFSDMLLPNALGEPQNLPTLYKLHREINGSIQTKSIDNPWIMTSGLTSGFMKGYFAGNFTPSSTINQTQSGFCLDGTYSNKHNAARMPSLRLMSSNILAIEDKEEDIIIGNGNCVTNESLVVTMNITPWRYDTGHLGVKFRSIWIKNPDFSKNYFKMRLKYKTL